MKPIAEEIQELRGLGVPELVEKYVEVFGRLPRTKQPRWLWRRIAWKIQEARFGGLSQVAKDRLEQLISKIDLPLSGARKKIKPARAIGTALGTTVARTYCGREIRATSVEGGWEHEGVVYRSLSAVARHVTHSHWNGRHFFGLTKRKVAQ